MQVLLPRRKKSQLESLANALAIVQAGFGVRNQIKNFDLIEEKIRTEQLTRPLKEQVAAAQAVKARREVEGVITPIEAQKNAKDRPIIAASKEDPGAFKVIIDGTETYRKYGKKPETELNKLTKLVALQKYKAEKNKQGIELQKEIKKDAREKKKYARQDAKEIKREVKYLSQKILKEGLPELAIQLNKIDRILKSEKVGIADGIRAVDPNKDIPGFGYTSVLGAVPFVGEKLFTEAGQDLRQVVQGLVNAILKARSGGAVTPAEADRLVKELEGANTDKSLLSGIRMVADTMQSKLGNITAAVSDKAVAEFASRGGLTDEMLSFRKKDTNTDDMKKINHNYQLVVEAAAKEGITVEEKLNQLERKAMGTAQYNNKMRGQ